jgi:catechol 2,3-dioxygenase-like lactoylglutathione lyase family enzyme/DNA-binding beta-propeller fold protein YncE
MSAQSRATSMPRLHHVGLNSLDPEKAIAWYLKLWPTATRTTVAGYPAVQGDMLVLFNKVDRPPAGAWRDDLHRAESQSAFWHIGANINTTDIKERLNAIGVWHLPLYTSPTDTTKTVWRSGLAPYVGTLSAAELAKATPAAPRDGGFSYVVAPDGVLFELTGGPGTRASFSHIHFYHEQPLCAANWYVEHLGMELPPVRRDSLGTESPRALWNPCDVKYGDAGWPSLEPIGTIRQPSGTVRFGNGTMSWYPRQCVGERCGHDQRLVPSRGQALDHVAFSVDDFDALYDKLRRDGVKILEAPHPFADTRAFMIEDPDGLSIELVASRAQVERRLYVTDASGVSVYDVDHGHVLLRRIAIPNSGDYKGIGASAQLGRLYVTSHRGDELIAIDLATDSVVWRKNVGKYADSFWVTPDGKQIWMPLRGEIDWKVLDAADGSTLGHVDTERGKRYDVDPIADIGPHNTWMDSAGRRVYMEVLTVPYIYIADAKSNALLGKIGPFSKGIRPFAVTDDERYLYASVDALLGFEVAEIARDFRGGKVVRRVEVHPPAERLAEIPEVPKAKPHSTWSHGINIRPDQKEVWMVDGVYGYVYAFDITGPAPKQIASIPLFIDPKQRPHPGWITFGIDGRYVYPDGGVVIDTRTKQVVARIPTSEKLIEVDFENGKAVHVGHR